MTEEPCEEMRGEEEKRGKDMSMKLQKEKVKRGLYMNVVRE